MSKKLLSERAMEIVDDIYTRTAIEAGTMAFYPRAFCDPFLLPLYLTKEKQILSTNNNCTISLSSENGLPHGHYARLLFAIITKTIRNNIYKDKVLISRSTRSLFVECTNGGIGGATQKEFIRTFNKLLTLSVSSIAHDTCNSAPSEITAEGKRFYLFKCDNIQIASSNITGIEIEPSVAFRQLLLDKKPFPIDMRAMHFFRLNKNVLAQDMYLYLTYKASGLTKTHTLLTWKILQQIFPNAISSKPTYFRKKVIKALILVKLVYKDLNAEIAPNQEGLIVYKSPPHIPKRLINTQK
jgi:hypothetical protein